eukprot:799889-Prymnesium_polylepis.1
MCIRDRDVGAASEQPLVSVSVARVQGRCASHSAFDVSAPFILEALLLVVQLLLADPLEQEVAPADLVLVVGDGDRHEAREDAGGEADRRVEAEVPPELHLVAQREQREERRGRDHCVQNRWGASTRLSSASGQSSWQHESRWVEPPRYLLEASVEEPDRTDVTRMMLVTALVVARGIREDVLVAGEWHLVRVTEAQLVDRVQDADGDRADRHHEIVALRSEDPAPHPGVLRDADRKDSASREWCEAGQPSQQHMPVVDRSNADRLEAWQPSPLKDRRECREEDDGPDHDCKTLQTRLPSLKVRSLVFGFDRSVTKCAQDPVLQRFRGFIALKWRALEQPAGTGANGHLMWPSGHRCNCIAVFTRAARCF